MGLPTFSTVVFFKFNKTKKFMWGPILPRMKWHKESQCILKIRRHNQVLLPCLILPMLLKSYHKTTSTDLRSTALNFSKQWEEKEGSGGCGNHGGNMYQQVSGRLVSVWHRRCILYSRARFVELQYYFLMYGWNQRYFKMSTRYQCDVYISKYTTDWIII